MLELYEYIPKTRHTDINLLPRQNITVFGVKWEDWQPYTLLWLPKRWEWN